MINNQPNPHLTRHQPNGRKQLKTTLAIMAFLLPAFCFSQNIKLQISTPQPRVGESFTISMDADSLSATVFKPISSKLNITSYNDPVYQGHQHLFANIEATKKGSNEIGPLKFNLNGKELITDKIKFDIVDSLPAVNKGLWIRKVPKDDSSCYILIDQRIPALMYVSHSENSIKMETKANSDEKEVDMVTEDIDNAKIESSSKTSETKGAAFDGTLRYKSIFSIFTVTIIDKKKPLLLKKNNFKDLPDDYKFTNIVIN